MKIKKYFIFCTTLIIVIITVYFCSNIIPSKIDYNFKKISNDNSFINNYTIENKNGRNAIYLDISAEIFKKYDYHSYISGEGTGRKINLEIYLVSKENSTCYKIKTYCYEYSNTENLKFLGYYYDKFIKQNEKYNLAIYVPENEILYMTNIEISNTKENNKIGTYKKAYKNIYKDCNNFIFCNNNIQYE